MLYVYFVLHNFCETQKSKIDLGQLKNVMLEERNKLNSYNSIQRRRLDQQLDVFFREYLPEEVFLKWTFHKILNDFLKKKFSVNRKF